MIKINNHVNNLCKKLNALAPLATFMNVNKRTIILPCRHST